MNRKPTDVEPDWRAIGFAVNGTRIRLRGIDRDAAIRALAARGMNAHAIADRLQASSADAIRAAARRISVQLPSAVDPAPWWVTYYDSTVDARRARGNERKREARRREQEVGPPDQERSRHSAHG